MENKKENVNTENGNLSISDVSCCYKCGAKIKKEGNSLHVWDIEYECGCKIWGAIGDKSNEIQIEVECNNCA